MYIPYMYPMGNVFVDVGFRFPGFHPRMSREVGKLSSQNTVDPGDYCSNQSWKIPKKKLVNGWFCAMGFQGRKIFPAIPWIL